MLKITGYTFLAAAFCGVLIFALNRPAQSESINTLLATADADAGKALSSKCTGCHTFDKDGAEKMGSNLWNIVNSSYAHKDGFKYSDALKDLNGKKKWTYEELDGFIASPKAHVPGNKMSMFGGVKDGKDRANLIAWMRMQADTPAALPAAK